MYDVMIFLIDWFFWCLIHWKPKTHIPDLFLIPQEVYSDTQA